MAFEKCTDLDILVTEVSPTIINGTGDVIIAVAISVASEV